MYIQKNVELKGRQIEQQQYSNGCPFEQERDIQQELKQNQSILRDELDGLKQQFKQLYCSMQEQQVSQVLQQQVDSPSL